MKFNRPTLVTLTSPTCAGKSTLLNFLTNEEAPLFTRIVSTTTRSPRANEKDGVDYHFISFQESLAMEKQDKFAELITFQGVRYGVTKDEMDKKMNCELSPIVILEPTGLKMYEKLCKENEWDIFRVFIYTVESLLLSRLAHRTANDIMLALSTYTDTIAKMSVEKLLNIHNKRVLSITGEERTWSHKARWDAMIPGDDMAKCISSLEIAINWKNSRSAVL
jgi:guanylate kinase